jgi:hypothetical protein
MVKSGARSLLLLRGTSVRATAPWSVVRVPKKPSFCEWKLPMSIMLVSNFCRVALYDRVAFWETGGATAPKAGTERRTPSGVAGIAIERRRDRHKAVHERPGIGVT